MPTPAALLALLSPSLICAQPVRVTVPVEGGGLSTNVGAGARNTTASASPALSAPAYNPSLTGASPSVYTPKVSVIGANPAAAVADPRMALPNAVSNPYSPRAEAAPQSRAVPRAEAGALPIADDPARRTPEGGSGGLSVIDTAVKDLDRAKKDEAEGGSGAVSGRLDALFDFTGARKGGALPELPKGGAAATVQGLPDPKVVGVEPALGKVATLARAAEPAEAHALYGRAMEIAREGLPPAQAAARVDQLRAEAAGRGPAAVKELAEKALAAAAQGRATDAIRYAKGVHGWDAMLSAPGRPYVENLPELTGTVKHVLKSALGGARAAAPAVRFESVRAKGGAKALRARFKFAKDADAPVSAVPAALAESLALPELKGFVAIEGPEAPEGPGLAGAFALRPEAGFRTLYRAAQAEGRTAWSSFWAAARAVTVSAGLTLWDQVKAFLVRALQALGVLRAAAPAGPLVDAPAPEVLVELRALEPERAERAPAPAGAPDALGLGYRLVSRR